MHKNQKKMKRWNKQEKYKIRKIFKRQRKIRHKISNSNI